MARVAAAHEMGELPDPRGGAASPVFGPGFGPVAASRASTFGTELEAAQLADMIRASDAPLRTENNLTSYPVEVDGLVLQLEPLLPSIGTVVHGLDLRRCSDRHLAFLRELLWQRRVVCFRGQQHLTRADHEAWAARWGSLGGMYGEHGVGDDPWIGRPPHPTHLGGDDLPKAEAGRHYLTSSSRFPTAASNWHSDATWAPKPPMLSALLCYDAPQVGGDTLFCDAVAMHAALPPSVQERIASLSCLHVSTCCELQYKCLFSPEFSI